MFTAGPWHTCSNTFYVWCMRTHNFVTIRAPNNITHRFPAVHLIKINVIKPWTDILKKNVPSQQKERKKACRMRHFRLQNSVSELNGRYINVLFSTKKITWNYLDKFCLKSSPRSIDLGTVAQVLLSHSACLSRMTPVISPSPKIPGNDKIHQIPKTAECEVWLMIQ